MVKLAIGYGNRGFFPPKYMAQARQELPKVLRAMGIEVVDKPVEGEDLGAVEDHPQGVAWANWLKKQTGIEGIVWTHPNFGNELGAYPALAEAGRAGTPILLHGYPDRMDKMGKDDRRDAYCGVMSTMDVLRQGKVPFIKLSPHVVSPSNRKFIENIDLFARICKGTAQDPYEPVGFEETTEGENVFDGFTLLAIGARTTPFMTCRYDELAAIDNRIQVHTEDFSTIIRKMDELPVNKTLWDKIQAFSKYTCWKKALEKDPKALEKQARFAVVVDEYIDKLNPDAVGIRCWTEVQEILHMSVCATLSYLNHGRADGRVIPAACEVDLGNALVMKLMNMYGCKKVACQDWNNNYKDAQNKLAFMHCGPHDTRWLDPKAELRDGIKGHYVETHEILDHSFPGPNMGCIQGRFKPGPVTIGSCTMGPGDLFFYFTEGQVTDDKLPPEYFGSAGVVEIPGLQNALIQIGHQGFKHHFSMGSGHKADECIAALRQHAGYKVMDLRPR